MNPEFMKDLRYWWQAALDPEASNENEDRIGKRLDEVFEGAVTALIDAVPIPWCGEHNMSMAYGAGPASMCFRGFVSENRLGKCRLEEPPQIYRITTDEW